MASASSLQHHDTSHTGLRRSNNQDFRGVLQPWSRELYRRRGWLFVVADGMGAHAAGEKASELAVQTVTVAYEKLAPKSPPVALKASIEDANAKIHAQGQTSDDLRGMGTTCTALALLPRGALVGHVGDSRAYRVRRGTIEQLSRDHSLVWEMEAETRAEAGESAVERVIPKNIITRSMGPHEKVAVDIEGPFPVEPDDVYVLCSDGLSGQVADEEIGAIAAALPPKAAGEALVGLTLVRGAPDNVTVIVARTGEKEKSRITPADPPWTLEEAEVVDGQRQRLPWLALAVAAGSLLGALLCYPGGDVMRMAVGEDWAETVGWPCVGLFALTCIGSLLAAVLGFLVPGGVGGRVLRPGQTLGKGPYRSYDCRPTPRLVEGIAASIESACDGLDVSFRNACTAPLARARSAAAAGDFTASFAALAEALAAFTRSVAAPR